MPGPPVIPGNIDLSQRQPFFNPDGSVSTVRSIGVNFDGLEYLLPTVANGQSLTEEDAIKRFQQTGEHLGAYRTQEEADAAAQQIHEAEAQRVGEDFRTPDDTLPGPGLPLPSAPSGPAPTSRPGGFLDFHRQRTGDPRSDKEILFDIAQHQPQLFDEFPDLKAQYREIVPPYQPGLGEEFTRGLKRGGRGLAESLYGFGALGAKVLGADNLAKKLAVESQRQGQLAGEAQGSVPSYRDIHDASSLMHYLIGGAGEVVPSAAEMGAIAAASALIGSAAGSAVEPVGGTAVGAAGGAITGLVAKQAVKSLMKKGITNITKDMLVQEAKAITARFGQHLGTALNSFALSSGEIYADLVDDKKIDPDKAVNASLVGGFFAAIPDTFLPSYVASKYLKGVAGKEVSKAAKNAFYGYLTRFISDAAKTIPMEGATEGFQEWVDIAAAHWAKGDAPVFSSLTRPEVDRIINATALGTIGGGIFAPVAAIPSEAHEGGPPPPPPPGTPPPPAGTTPPAGAPAGTAPGGTPPAAPGVTIDPALAAYTEILKKQPGLQGQLEAMARQELGGTPLDVKQQAALNSNPDWLNAYTIIKSQMEEDAKKAAASAAGAAPGTTTATTPATATAPGTTTATTTATTPGAAPGTTTPTTTTAAATTTTPGFTTEHGSTYVLHDDGTTTRTKAARAWQPGDSGPKDRSQRTVYIGGELAREIGMFQGLSVPDKIVVLHNGKVLLGYRTGPDQVFQWERTVSDPSFSETPEVGKSPLELFNKTEGRYPGGAEPLETYLGNHPGSPIVSINQPAAAPGTTTATTTTTAPTGTTTAPQQRPNQAQRRQQLLAGLELEHPETVLEEPKVGQYPPEGWGKTAKLTPAQQQKALEKLQESLKKAAATPVPAPTTAPTKAEPPGLAPEHQQLVDALLKIVNRVRGVSVHDYFGALQAIPTAIRVLEGTIARLEQAGAAKEQTDPLYAALDRIDAFMARYQKLAATRPAPATALTLFQKLMAAYNAAPEGPEKAQMRQLVELLYAGNRSPELEKAIQDAYARFVAPTTTTEGGEISDQTNKPGLPGGQQQGQAAIKAKLEQASGEEKTTTGGVLQTSKEVGGLLDPAAMEDLIDDLDDDLFEPQPSTHSKISALGFFRVLKELGEKFSIKLGNLLTQNFRTGDSKADTRQIAFFLDKQTGEVIGLGTAKIKARILEPLPDQFKVGRLPGRSQGTSLKRLMASGRYVPIASMTRKTPGKYSTTSFRFKNRKEFEAFAQRAEEKLRATAAYGGKAGLEPDEGGEERGEEGQKKRVRVDKTTPADELAAKEGFTKDEAHILFDALKDVRIFDLAKGLGQAMDNNPDLVHALQRLIRVLENADKTLTEDEKKDLILSTIALAKNDAGNDKKAFARSITQRVGAQIRGSIEETRSSLQKLEAERAAARAAVAAAAKTGATVAPAAAPTGTGAAPAATTATTGVTGAEPTAAGAAATGTTGGATGETIKWVKTPGGLWQRGHAGTFEEPYRGAPSDVASAFNSAIQALANAGYDVNLIRAEIAQLLTGFGGERGLIDNANEVVSLVMANTAQPTTTNLYHLNAEVAHAVFSGLSTEQQQLLQEAIRNATNEMLGIKGEFAISEAIPEGQREAVQQEERLVDVVARAITAQGFNAAEAATLAQRFWRFLKSAILRAAMALGRTWGLSPEAQARLAADYLQVRVEQFLAGNISPYSFTDFLGGGRTQVQDANARHTATNGMTSVQYRFNPDKGQIEVQEVLANSVSAALSNAQNPTVRYHGPQSRNDPAQVSLDVGPEIIRYDVASNNEMAAAVADHLRNWENTGGGNMLTTPGAPPGAKIFTPQEFSEWVLDDVMEQPDVTIAGLNNGLVKLGQTPQNPALRLADLNTDAQRNAAAKTYGFFSRLKSIWEKRYADADYQRSGKPGSMKKEYDRKVIQTLNLVNNYTDALFLWDEIKNDVVGWMEMLKKNGEKMGDLTHEDGVLEQIIKDTEGRLDKPLTRDYYQVINKLVNRFATSDKTKTDFVEMLQSIAATGIPWENMSAKQITEMLQHPELEQATASTFELLAKTPTLGLLRENTLEGRALRAITAAFLKTNAVVADFLALRKSDAMQDRQEVNKALRTAMSDQQNAFDNAKRDLRKDNTLATRATRLLVRLEELQRKQRVTLDRLNRYKLWMEFYENATGPMTGLLTKQMAAMEKIMGVVKEEFEPVPDAIMLTPENPNEPPDNILKRSQDPAQQKKYSVERDGIMDDELRRQFAAMEAWLEANKTTDYYGGNVYNRIASQVEKIRENDMQARTDKGSRSFWQATFSPVVAKLEATGLPAFKALARMYRKYDTFHYRYRYESVTWSNQWGKLAKTARKALGYGRYQFENFLERYYDPSFDFIKRRLDFQVGSATDIEAENRAYAGLRSSLFSTLTTKQWDALEAFLRKTAEVSWNIRKASEAMGIRIEDKDADLFRATRGAKTFEVGQMMQSTIRRIIDDMYKGQPGKPGPWAGKPLADRDLAAEHRADPAALRASLAPLFAGEFWDHWVRPLANRSARSAFKAPPDAGKFARLATVAETQQALAATPKGDVVTFAEKLFDLAGGPALGADKSVFVAETLDTFNKYAGWLHGMTQRESNMADKIVIPVRQLLLNARETDEMPAEWVKVQRYDLHSIRGLMNQLALHAAFGRNLDAAEKLWTRGDDELKKREDKLLGIARQTNLPGVSGWERRKRAIALAKTMGESLPQLERASKDLAMSKFEHGNFTTWVKANSGVAMEFKWWSQLLSLAVAVTVQGPKTAFIDTTSLFKPIQEIGLSTQSLAWTYRNIKATLMQPIGGFVEILGKTIRWEADKIRMMHEMAQFPAADQFGIRDRIAAVVLANSAAPNAGLGARIASALAIAAGSARELLNISIPKLASNPQFIALKPAVFTAGSQMMHLGSIMGTWGTFEDMVVRAARWLNNPARATELADPTFRFDKQHAEALGYGPKFWSLLNDAAAFESLLAKLQVNGQQLEHLAKDYLKRGMTGPVMNMQAYARLMTIAPTELMQESSITSRASWLLSNPIAHTAMPLVGWSLSQLGSLFKLHRKDISGEFEGWKGVRKFILKLTPIIGVSLAYAILADWYDEELLHKKSNRLTFSGDNAAMAFIDKMSLIGVFGPAGDLANSAINVSTARDFSIDSRVFAVSAFLGLLRAGSTWYQQGSASYQTVGRPMLQALGGSGGLQYLQIFNNLFSLDNAESRATARINVNNWLRVGGRGLDYEVRTGRTTQFIPSSTTPYVREMALAAMANDPTEFRAAYKAAIAAARKDKREDPEDYVKRAYQQQNPLRSVFETRISENEYHKLLLSLPENGKRDVSEALRLLNNYGERIDIEPYYGTKEQDQLKAAMKGLDLNKLFKQAALTPRF